jgi:hypothetical protein
MSHSGQNVDTMEGEVVVTVNERNEMEAVNSVDMMEVEDPQPQEERRKRGPTMCTKTSGKSGLHIEFRKDGTAKGANRIEYSNWCTNLVKQKASILVESWDKFSDKEHKDPWWDIVKVKYPISLFSICIN